MAKGITQEQYDQILLNMCSVEEEEYEPQEPSKMYIDIKTGELREITYAFGAPITIQYHAMMLCMDTVAFVGKQMR